MPGSSLGDINVTGADCLAVLAAGSPDEVQEAKSPGAELEAAEASNVSPSVFILEKH